MILNVKQFVTTKQQQKHQQRIEQNIKEKKRKVFQGHVTLDEA